MENHTAMKACLAGLWVLALLTAAPLHGATPALVKEITADVQFEDALRIVNLADQATREGHYEDARELYREAYHAHSILCEQYPRWNPEAVRKRIEHCTERMNALGDILDSDERGAPHPNAGGKPADSGLGGAANRGDPASVPATPPVNMVQRQENRPPAVPSRQPAHSTAAPAKPPIRTDPDIVASLALIKATARQRLDAGSSAGAREILMEGLRMDPDDHTIRLLLGLAQCHSGRFEDGAMLLRTLLEEDPTDAYAHLYLASALTGLGRLDEAATELRLAIGNKPQLHQAHFNLAQILLRMDAPDIAGAREHYRTSLRYGGTADRELAKQLSTEP
jgi:tetratricopeptide (TPR) repeat protein